MIRSLSSSKPEENEECNGGGDDKKASDHGCPKHLNSPLPDGDDDDDVDDAEVKFVGMPGCQLRKFFSSDNNA